MRPMTKRQVPDRQNTAFPSPERTPDPSAGRRPERNTEDPRRFPAPERARPAAGGKRRLYTLLPLLLCGPPLLAETNTASKQVRVVFRFDDVSATSKVQTETRLIEAFRERHLCCAWAIVPYPPLGAKAGFIAEAVRAGVLEITLHGYTHESNGLQKGVLSEFDRLPYEDQLQRIQKGKQSLEAELKLSRPIRVFIPPWDSYDANTIRAVEASRFHCLASSLSGQVGSSTTLALLPATCEITGIREAVIAARTAPDPAPIVVVLFHPYAFREDNEKLGVMTLDQFIETLQWLTRQPDVKVVSMSEVSDLSRARYLANQHLYARRRWLPLALRDHLPYSRVLFSVEGARIIRRREWLPVVGFYAGFYGGWMLAVGVAAFLTAGMVFARWSGGAARLLWFSGPALLVCSLVWAFHSGHFGGRIRLLAALLGAGAWCAGICAAKIRRRIVGPASLKTPGPVS
jgi:predicted deacetylase